MYTDTGSNFFKEGEHGESSVSAGRIRAVEKGENADPNRWGVGKLGDVEHALRVIEERFGGAYSQGADQLRPTDFSPGGIVSRLLTEKMERLGEVRGRLEIVNKRRDEYAEAIVKLEREIEEIRAIAQELRPDLPPVSEESS